MAQDAHRLLDDLNDEQRRAVQSTDGPVMVLAGAGSGKTRVITARIAHLVRSKGVAPEQILAVTFTNKAAREMSQRVAAVLKGGKPTLCTFHAFAVRLLRAHISRLGQYTSGFVIFDAQDQLSLVKTLLEEGDFDPTWIQPGNALFELNLAKSRGVTAEELLSHHQTPHDLNLGTLLAQYQQTLRRMNAVDFEDLLLLALQITQEHPEAAQQFFAQWRYVMVDEYQDTNLAQYRLLREIVKAHGNVCVVGDDDQSIYGWRGAEPGNLLDFELHFPGARVIRLERNYRSTDTILSAANQVIANNRDRHGKTLRGLRGPGKPLEWLLGEDERDELEKVVTHLKLTKMRTGAPLSDFAILYRSNHQSRAVEELLREEGLPYALVGGTRFYDRKEVKDALAYLRLVANPLDEVSLLRVLNFPKRGIGRTSQMRLMETAQHQLRRPWEVLQEATQYGSLDPTASRAMEHFARNILEFQERFATEPLGPTFRALLEDVGFHRAVEKEKADPKSGERAAALVYELERATDLYTERNPQATLKDYLEYLALFTLADDDEETRQEIALMTVHSAKGLEFPYVYLINLADDLFPNKKALADGTDAEERRLFYVAVTRAEQQLALSMARQRRRWGETVRQQPSRFVLEIDPSLFASEVPHQGYTPSAEKKAERTASARDNALAFMRKLKESSAGG